MNKILFNGLLLISTVLLLDSCNSALSITKRRYTKGYYVQHKHAPSSPKENQKTTQLSKGKSSSSQALTKKQNIDLKKQETLTANAELPKKTRHQVKVERGIQIPAELTITNPIKTLTSLKKQIKESNASTDALSLMWILILILLIVYVAGLVLQGSGSSWLIHLLLVAALVLLILWLLRIV